jgi:fatty-acyl-CoA synthase
MKWINFLDVNEATLPSKVAIVDQSTQREYTYSELAKVANQWALFLEENGVTRGDRVAILATNRIEHLTLLFACAKLGAILVPLNFRLAIGEINKILERIEAKILFGTGESCLTFDGKYIDLAQFELGQSYEITSERFVKTQSTLDDDILMQFTSGSTGEPKGVLMHGRMLHTNMVETARNWELIQSDITMVETPFFHTGGYNVLCLPLLALGGTIILAPKFDMENVFDTIEKHQVSVYFGVPTMFQMMAESEKFKTADMSSIRFFVSGGAACPVELIEEYQRKDLPFKQGFGLTEVGPNCFLLHEDDAIRKVGSIGRPMSHSHVEVITLTGEKAKVGEVGELRIKGDHLCRGYFNDEEKYQSSLSNSYFKTGDLVRFDEQGFFYVVGRIKDMYISGGENVYPGEVEKQLLSIPEVQDAVVVAIKNEKWGEVGHAFLKTESKDINLDLVRDFLKEKLSRYKHPHSIECMETFPLLANGKINRVELKSRVCQ